MCLEIAAARVLKLLFMVTLELQQLTTSMSEMLNQKRLWCHQWRWLCSSDGGDAGERNERIQRKEEREKVEGGVSRGN